MRRHLSFKWSTYFAGDALVVVQTVTWQTRSYGRNWWNTVVYQSKVYRAIFEKKIQLFYWIKKVITAIFQKNAGSSSLCGVIEECFMQYRKFSEQVWVNAHLKYVCVIEIINKLISASYVYINIFLHNSRYFPSNFSIHRKFQIRKHLLIDLWFRSHTLYLKRSMNTQI